MVFCDFDRYSTYRPSLLARLLPSGRWKLRLAKTTTASGDLQTDKRFEVPCLAGHRRNIDELPASLRLEIRERRSDAPKHTLDIDIDALVPLIETHHLERRERHEACIVDHHVDAPEGLDRMTDERLDLLAVRHLHFEDGAVLIAQLLGQSFEPIQAAGPKSDFRAFLHQISGAFRAKARTGTVDDSYPARRDGLRHLDHAAAGTTIRGLRSLCR